MPASILENGLTSIPVPENGLSADSATLANISSNGASTNASSITVMVDSTNGEAKGGFLFPELEGKDATQQLEILNGLLEKETRIKDGAENLLKMQLTVSLE